MRLLSSPPIQQSLTICRKQYIASKIKAKNQRYYQSYRGFFAAQSTSPCHHPALDRRNDSEQNLSANIVTDSQIPRADISAKLQGRLYSTSTSLPVAGAPSAMWTSTASIAGCSTGILTGNSGVWMRTQSTISTNSSQSNIDDGGNSNQSDKKEKSKRRKKQMSKAATGMKDLVKKYGWTFVGTYGVVYVMTLGTLFVGINWGWMDPPSLTLGDWGGGTETILEGIGVPADEAVEMKQLEADGEGFTQKWIIENLQSYEWTKKYADKLGSNPSWINLGVAWVATKLTEPFRLGVAVGVTPRVAKFFGSAPSDDDEVEENGEENVKEETQPSTTIPQKAEDEMTFSVRQEKKEAQ